MRMTGLALAVVFGAPVFGSTRSPGAKQRRPRLGGCGLSRGARRRPRGRGLRRPRPVRPRDRPARGGDLVPASRRRRRERAHGERGARDADPPPREGLPRRSSGRGEGQGAPFPVDHPGGRGRPPRKVFSPGPEDPSRASDRGGRLHPSGQRRRGRQPRRTRSETPAGGENGGNEPVRIFRLSRSASRPAESGVSRFSSETATS